MNEHISSLSLTLERITGIEGTLGYLIIIICAIIGNAMFHALTNPNKNIPPPEPDEEDEDVEPPRNFTLKQLRHFDGTYDEQMQEDKPVYLALEGTVFDVTSGKDFYGPGGPYETFAGRECGLALAKMSFDEEHLDDISGCKDLNYGEQDSLDGWFQQFKYMKNYPIAGKVIPDDKLPSPDRILTAEVLAKNNGAGEVPEGYGVAPIYIGAQGNVYDASFGGVTFYGSGCSYNRFAGVDASRALAKMSFDPIDVENPDCSTLTEKEKKVLSDWVKTFKERKGYPCVGKLGN